MSGLDPWSINHRIDELEAVVLNIIEALQAQDVINHDMDRRLKTLREDIGIVADRIGGT